MFRKKKCRFFNTKSRPQLKIPRLCANNHFSHSPDSSTPQNLKEIPLTKRAILQILTENPWCKPRLGAEVEIGCTHLSTTPSLAFPHNEKNKTPKSATSW